MLELIPASAIIAIVVIALIVIFLAVGYVKAPPDMAFIISGIKKKSKIVIGKAAIRIPFFERLDKLNLRLIPIDVKTSNAVPTADYININVDATVNVKISNESEKLRLAAENFLNKNTEYIAGVAREVLEGNVREIVGKMKLEEMVSDRQKFATLVKENAEPDLAAMGLDIISFNVQNFVDGNEVIENLGIDNIVKIKKAAAIARAESERDIYDTTVVDEEDIGWDILWDEDYSGRILMFDNPRDAFAIAENMLGYSLNTENSEELEKAAEKLKEQKKVVQAYVMDEIFDKMGAGEAIIAPYYAGDAVTLMDEYEDLGFVIPDSGTNLFIDAVCIPKGCRNKEAAEMYINFLNEPDVAYAIADFIGYSTPNQKAYEMLDDEVKNDGISYLDDDYIEEKTTVFCNLSDEANQKMQTLWTDMKSSEEQTPNKVIVPAFMSVCVIASLIILIRRYIKKKKDMF